MGHKIFVSYKYADDSVQSLHQHLLDELRNPTTVRSYVDRLQGILSLTNHTNKGEDDDEDLSQYNEYYIWEKLKDRIYDSTVTIVMVSPHMRVLHKREKDQWIPWEISFSLRETTRNDRTSHTNAVLAVVLPDRNGKYDYYLQWLQATRLEHCISPVYGGMFAILQKNMFNRKPSRLGLQGLRSDEPSYIKSIFWNAFILKPNSYIEKAISIKNDADYYNIQKEV